MLLFYDCFQDFLCSFSVWYLGALQTCGLSGLGSEYLGSVPFKKLNVGIFYPLSSSVCFPVPCVSPLLLGTLYICEIA